MTIERENPYFNRTTFAFSSHQHTPNDPSARFPAASTGADGGYISSELFSEYARKGSLIAKLLLHGMIDRLLGEKTIISNLPAQSVATLMDQPAESRLVCHLLYASCSAAAGLKLSKPSSCFGVCVSVKTGNRRRVYRPRDDGLAV